VLQHGWRFHEVRSTVNLPSAILALCGDGGGGSLGIHLLWNSTMLSPATYDLIRHSAHAVLLFDIARAVAAAWSFQIVQPFTSTHFYVSPH
jgi:hypothetical protein